MEHHFRAAQLREYLETMEPLLPTRGAVLSGCALGFPDIRLTGPSWDN